MDPGDIMYSNVCTQPLAILVRRGDGQFFDFVGKAFAPVVKPIDKARFCLALTPDPILPTTQRCVIPVAARQDPQAELIEAILPAGLAFPQPTQTDWIAVDNGVPMGLARGVKMVFTG